MREHINEQCFARDGHHEPADALDDERAVGLRWYEPGDVDLDALCLGGAMGRSPEL